MKDLISKNNFNTLFHFEAGLGKQSLNFVNPGKDIEKKKKGLQSPISGFSKLHITGNTQKKPREKMANCLGQKVIIH